jgi:hypothetical protein
VAAVVTMFMALWCLAWPPGETRAAQETTRSPFEVLHAAINSDDLAAAIAVFADDAVVIQPRIGGLAQIYVGREQIRFWLRGLSAQHAGVEQLTATTVSGRGARWSEALAVDAFRELGLDRVELASDAVVDGDGRILSLTSVLTPEAARRLARAPMTVREESPATPDASSLLSSLAPLCGAFGVGLATVPAVVLVRRRHARVIATR